MKSMPLLAALSAAMMVAGAALAQPATVDKSYEDAKAADISAARLSLAARPAAAGVQELNEAETLLRRLRSTKGADARRKLAAELDLAITRLSIVANDGGSGIAR